MASDLWLASMQTENDHRVARTLAGDAELLRPRLAEAAERLGYQVIADQTAVVARRGARGGAGSGCSLDVRDYPTELIVTLKPKGSAVLATFNFNVKNYYYWAKGDRATLALEADALAALAVAQPSHAACAACGTETTDDSRFCRRCGTPLALEEPAELETLRLAAGTRVAHKSVSWGLFTLSLTAAIMLLVFLLGEGDRAYRAAFFAASIGGTTGFLMLLAGAWKHRRTLSPAREPERPAVEVSPRTFGAPRTAAAALPPRAAQFSVTESTTELLEEPARRPAQASARRGDGDTGPIN